MQTFSSALRVPMHSLAELPHSILKATMNFPKTETPGHQKLCAPSVWITWKMEGAHKRCSRTLRTSLPPQLKHPKDSWCLHPKWEITESHLGVSPLELSLSMAPSEERLDIKQCPGCMRDATGCPGLSLCGGHPWLSLSLAVRVSLCAFVNGVLAVSNVVLELASLDQVPVRKPASCILREVTVAPAWSWS